jgi:hypothetical protein
MKTFVFKDHDGETLWRGEAETLADAISLAMDDNLDLNVEYIDLGGHDLSGIPIVLDIDRAILRAVERYGRLNMETWHGFANPNGRHVVPFCGTTHCRAGWAIHLAGEAGYALEQRSGAAEIAGALIYAASRPGVPIPNFFASNDEALADLRACAAASRPEPTPSGPIDVSLAGAMADALAAFAAC